MKSVPARGFETFLFFFCDCESLVDLLSVINFCEWTCSNVRQNSDYCLTIKLYRILYLTLCGTSENFFLSLRSLTTQSWLILQALKIERMICKASMSLHPLTIFSNRFFGFPYEYVLTPFWILPLWPSDRPRGTYHSALEWTIEQQRAQGVISPAGLG